MALEEKSEITKVVRTLGIMNVIVIAARMAKNVYMNIETPTYDHILANMNCLHAFFPPCWPHAEHIPIVDTASLYLFTVPLHPLSIRLPSRLPQLRKISISNYISSSLWGHSILEED